MENSQQSTSSTQKQSENQLDDLLQFNEDLVREIERALQQQRQEEIRGSASRSSGFGGEVRSAGFGGEVRPASSSQASTRVQTSTAVCTATDTNDDDQDSVINQMDLMNLIDTSQDASTRSDAGDDDASRQRLQDARTSSSTEQQQQQQQQNQQYQYKQQQQPRYQQQQQQSVNDAPKDLFPREVAEYLQKQLYKQFSNSNGAGERQGDSDSDYAAGGAPAQDGGDDANAGAQAEGDADADADDEEGNDEETNDSEMPRQMHLIEVSREELPSENATAGDAPAQAENEPKRYRIKYSNGDMYEGETDEKTKLKDGFGIYYYATGEKYEGFFQDDLIYGYGKYQFLGGHSYEGDWIRGKKAGPGRLTFSSGDYYQGDFWNDTYNGEGELVYKNGDRFTGQFKNGKKNGYGKFYGAGKNGRRIFGNWKDDDLQPF